jgi:hypothetical protein
MSIIKTSQNFLLVLFLFISTTLLSQCRILEAQELENYKRTTDRIEDGITKVVQSDWQQSSSNFEFHIFLYYQQIGVSVDKMGMNKGSITFKISNIGKIFNGVIFYSDGTFENISPFHSIWDNVDVSTPTEFSFSLKGDVFSTVDEITEFTITQVPKPDVFMKDSIDLSKMPTKIVLLTEKGSKEYKITTEDYLNIQCILNRYKTPYKVDIR